jgi:hypothetical protein
MNEAASVIKPPITIVWMLPIIQAPADDNDTLTTVISRFMAISHHMGQTHTIIAADQPLCSEELVWVNQFESVIWTVQEWMTYGLRLRCICSHYHSEYDEWQGLLLSCQRTSTYIRRTHSALQHVDAM